ncbi:MAG: hypothetical protein KAR38_15650, partial [Calditrichia bacterium]|nr:hypothetical protein [Calditrichia bacterium]
ITSLLFAVNGNDSITVSTSQIGIQLDLITAVSTWYDENRTATLTLPAGYGVEASLSQTIPLEDGQLPLNWNIQAPGTPRPFEQARVIVKATSSVNNSNIADTAYIALQTVKRASVSINAAIVEPQGAIDGIVSYGQEFTVAVNYENSGTAPLISDSAATIQLTLDNYFELVEGNNPMEVLPDETGLFTIRVDSSQEAKEYFFAKYAVLGKQSKNNVKEKFDFGKQQLSFLNTKESKEDIASFIKVEFIENPYDSFTGVEAFIEKISDSLAIIVKDSAHIDIDDVICPEFVSTSQRFTIRVDFDIEEVVENDTATLSTTYEGFTIVDPVRVVTGNSITWDVTAPEFESLNKKGLKSADIFFSIHVQGYDSNLDDPEPVTADSSWQFTLQKEARIDYEVKIVDPPNALDGNVSTSQTFKVAAVLRNIGEAQTTGNGSVRLQLKEDDNFQLVGEQDSTRAFTTPTGMDSIVWTLIAPNKSITSNIPVRLISTPTDVNTNLQASIVSPLTSASVSVQFRRMVVDYEPAILDSIKFYRQGETSDRPILAFTIENEDAETNIAEIGEMLLQFNDQNGDSIDASQLFETIKISNFSFYKNGAGKNNNPFVTDPVAPEQDDSLNLIFDPRIAYAGGVKDTIVVLATFNSQNKDKSFSVSLRDLVAYQENTNLTVAVETTTGKKLSETEGIQSLTRTLISTDGSDSENICFNYPNPFGRASDITKFVFFLKNPGNVSIKIFTLTGKLVSEKEITGLGRGLHDGEIDSRLIWDGYNDKDKNRKILNGVYI